MIKAVSSLSALWVFLTLACYLLSVEQKNETQGLWVFLSEEGGRYMASEKQARSSFSSSVLQQQTQQVSRTHTRSAGTQQTFTQQASPVEVMDVVQRRRLSEAHPRLPDVLAAVYGLHVLGCILEHKQR